VTADTQRHEDCHVLDASALLRLYLADGPLPADLETVMERGCRGEGVLLIPDLCWLEMTSVLRKQVIRERLSPVEVSEILGEILRLPLRALPTADFCLSAFQLSEQYLLTVYDASYLAVALRHGAVLISADERLASAARRSGCGP
jgi:predicted nucleic acid-binding protein